MRGRIQELWGNTEYSNISEVRVLEEKNYGYIFLQKCLKTSTHNCKIPEKHREDLLLYYSS